jgi:hypothetical protein
MAFYQETRTAKAAAVGTIMPWTGGVSAVPKGWILCNGDQLLASSYPLLARAIGDTYNADISDFGGAFPNYAGSITLPLLNNKTLMDIEPSYFGSGPGSTGSAIEADPTSGTQITPLIGSNTDNGIRTVFNDVTTDVVFTLNERSGFAGKLSGNTILGGEATKTVYIAPRKLSRDHLPAHNHSGRYETVSRSNQAQPGDGVIPYEAIEYNLVSTWDRQDTTSIFGAPNNDDEFVAELFIVPAYTADNKYNGKTAFGGGSPGRVVARIVGENPPINYTPIRVARTPLSAVYFGGQIDGNSPVPYGLGGETINVGAGSTNYYPDLVGSGNFGTLTSNAANNFEQIIQTPGREDVIQPHTHDEFEVNFVRGGMRPNTSLVIDVEAPNANLNLDNASNRGALQVNFNTSQPSLTCIYIIRAY